MYYTQPLKQSQRGSAIIVALFVVSLVAAAAVAMAVRLHIDVRRTELSLSANQANLFAQGSIAWAIDTLINDSVRATPNRIVDVLPLQSKADKIQGYTVVSTITDEQGKFNLINLMTANSQLSFVHLVQAINPKFPTADAINLALAIQNWMFPTSNDQYDAYYAKQNPPYRGSHHAMMSASELRLVKGMTAELYNALLPYITALPEITNININSAPPPVLMSLSPTLTPENAKAVALNLQKQPFVNTQSVQTDPILRTNPVDAGKITVLSNYFLVKTDVSIGQQHTILYTLLLRTIVNSKPAVTIVWQTKGTV